MVIGIGSPAFADDQFKQEVEKHFKNNFHFYVNKQDLVVHLFPHIMRYEGNIDKLIKMIESCNPKLPSKNIALIKTSIGAIGLLKNLGLIPNYQHFGRFIYFDDDKYEISDYKYSEKGFIREDHDKLKYLERLANIYKKDKINVVRDKNIEVDDYDELSIPINKLEKRGKYTICENNDCNNTPCNKYSVEIWKSFPFWRETTCVSFNVCCQNADYILRASLEIDDQIREYITKERFGRNSLKFMFLIESKLLFKAVEEQKAEVLKSSKLAINFQTHFDNDRFEFLISDCDLVGGHTPDVFKIYEPFITLVLGAPLPPIPVLPSASSMKLVTIENEDHSKEIRLFITNDSKLPPNINNSRFGVFDSFNTLKQKLGTWFGVAKPKFESYFNSMKPIETLDQMLLSEETRFILH